MKYIKNIVLYFLVFISFNLHAQKKNVQKSNYSKSLYPFEEQNQIKKLNKKGIELSNPSILLDPVSIESIFDTKISVCRSGNSCSAGINYMSGNLALSDDLSDRTFNFKWGTKRDNLSGVCWQVSKYPFTSSVFEVPNGLVAQGISTDKYKQISTLLGNFDIDFSMFDGSPLTPMNFELKKKTKNRKATNIGLASNYSIPKIYYVRLIPMVGNNLVYGSSNVIQLVFGEINSAGEIHYVAPVNNTFPDIYSVKIKDFMPIVFPTMKWGTVYVDGFDEKLYKKAGKTQAEKTLNASLREMFQQKLNNHQPIVPESYKGEGSEGWVESLWDAANSTVNWVSSSYNWAKQQLVNIAAELVDELPLVDCNDDCKALLKTGLEAGMIALGVPPSLPSAEQLMNEGMDYLAAEISAQVGCGAPCEDIIKEKLIDLGKEISFQQRMTIANEEIAHRNGVEPMEFPNWVNVHIAPESGIQLPKLTFELKRKHFDVSQIPTVDLNKYFLRISFYSTSKHYKKGNKINVPVDTDYKDGFAVNTVTGKLKLESNPIAQLWASRIMSVPVLEEGDKITIPVNLNQVPYLFPGHLDLIRKNNGHIFYDDWSNMYIDGKLSITIELLGKEIEPITFNEIYRVLSIETKVVNLPNEYNGGYILPRRIQ